MRTIAVGDIHGCSKALLELLDILKLQPDDHIVFLGDYVDRGPDSRGVIEILLELQQKCQTTFLAGNHEIMFRGVLDGLAPEIWLSVGGMPTLTSYGGKLEHVSKEHRVFLKNLLPYLETEQHIFVHANYYAALAMELQPEQALYWDHLTDRLPQPHSSGKHVFLGHTPQANGNIGEYRYFTCLDTGCFAGYWLSAMDVNTRETWQISKEGHQREYWRVAKQCWRFVRRLIHRQE